MPGSRQASQATGPGLQQSSNMESHVDRVTFLVPFGNQRWQWEISDFTVTRKILERSFVNEEIDSTLPG